MTVMRALATQKRLDVRDHAPMKNLILVRCRTSWSGNSRTRRIHDAGDLRERHPVRNEPQFFLLFLL